MTDATDHIDRWLTAGIAVFHGSTDPSDLPPVDDPAAQRAWLGGFAAAWAECPEGAGGLCELEPDEALVVALRGQPELLGRLRGLGGGEGSAQVATLH